MTMVLKKDVRDLPDSAYHNQPVLVRVDFNVPVEDGRVTSDHRIVQALPTLHYLLQRGAKLIVMTHLGRPKGTVDPAFSVQPVVDVLKTHLLSTPVQLADLPFSDDIRAKAQSLHPGSILMLENIRFEAGETKNDPKLAQQLASLADIYVNDAFGAAHRAHASTEGVARLAKTKVAGLLMSKELSTFGQLLDNPPKPVTAIIGGSKVSSKIGVLTRLVQQVNTVVIGGGMVFTFLKAQGVAVGSSLVEDDYLDLARGVLDEARQLQTQIVLPTDVVIADRFAADAAHEIVDAHLIKDGWMGLDIGPKSTQSIVEIIRQSNSVFWNGPLGVFEFPAFAQATRTVAEAIAQETRQRNLISVLGGGDTEAAIERFGLPEADYTHISTGGGASLELMEGKELPGVTVLDDKCAVPAGQ